MGLTVHYGMKSSTKSIKRARYYVEQMRQLALDLPFEEVGEIIEVKNPTDETIDRLKDKNESLRWMLIQAQQIVSPPWNKKASTWCSPTHMFAVNVWPGPGSEPANMGLCLYPETIKFDYADLPTKLTGWRWRSFCKTQYASNPNCGGIPNFLRCHISLITLLDRISELPTIKVSIDDEGKYGPSHYTDNWRVPNPVYTWHEGKYNVKALVEEIGNWNDMIAAFAGALGDAVKSQGMEFVSPITEFPNFEQLEFKGAQNTDTNVDMFLKVMKEIAKKNTT